MSGATGRGRVGRHARRVGEWALGPRPLALLSAAVLVGSVVTVLYDIVGVVGDPSNLLVVVAVTLAGATVLSRVLRGRTAIVVALAVLLGGLGLYLSALDIDVAAAYGQILDDVVGLLTGLSVLRLQRVDLWALAYAPAPVFLTWYLALRRQYGAAAATGGTGLGFFVLTGDVGTTVTLFAVLGAVGTAGFGRLDRFSSGSLSVETLVVVLAAIVLLTTTVSVVPGGTAEPVQLLGGDADGETLEGSLVSADQRVSIQGAIELSPELRFTVESNRESYWRAAAYDRYTGGGWVRTGSEARYEGPLSGPLGRSRTISQRYTVEAPVDVMPAAWRPVRVSGTDNTLVTEARDLRPAEPFTGGETYEVESQRPVARPAALATAGTDYPEEIAATYTQLPESTPDRVRERTDRITANADTPYETARVVERWLENNRRYSLDIERPSGDVADAFLFEMEAGYCTYYATTMVTMLRSQGIPARFVVGYTSGEQVGDGEWEVRGLDSHAWVEVYFPDTGWVRFDPTPGGPREAAEQARLGQTNGTDPANATATPPPLGNQTARQPDDTNATVTETPDGQAGGTVAPPGGASGGDGLPLPSRGQLALGAVVLAGLVAGARRTGLTDRAYRALWLRYQPRADPATDIERAFARLETVLASEHRPRRPGETPRQYVAAIDADETVQAVYEARERARYAGEVSRSTADEAVETVDAIVAERGWFSFGR
ncbi:transglutaminase TgpA family protein [Halorientalis litorea]|uniref:transglutaminase TgpA family protein n=1 Tax=Halorientalis litorea TaxID=2931977 RepID=UPI001FF40FEC|nr:transglutaminaseTgpA domain-containing protein [Halorientalis litorea]